MFSGQGEKGPAEGEGPGHGAEELTMSISIRGTGGGADGGKQARKSRAGRG